MTNQNRTINNAEVLDMFYLEIRSYNTSFVIGLRDSCGGQRMFDGSSSIPDKSLNRGVVFECLEC